MSFRRLEIYGTDANIMIASIGLAKCSLSTNLSLELFEVACRQATNTFLAYVSGRLAVHCRLALNERNQFRYSLKPRSFLRDLAI